MRPNKEDSKIKLTDILKLTDITNTKIRLNLMFDGNWNPIELFQKNKMETLLTGMYWNYNKQKSYKEGQTTLGFIRINNKEDFWLLYHVGLVTKDLNIFNGLGYEYKTLKEYEKYFGRLIIEYKNKSQNMVRMASSMLDECIVSQILPDIFDNDRFPGYDKVYVSYEELELFIKKSTWRTALQNQKGVYLISDTSNGKKYVGSAYGDDMLLNRWENYIKTGHGGNVGLLELPVSHIKDYFRFSILDIYKSTTPDAVILERESYWKQVLNTREFGYNKN